MPRPEEREERPEEIVSSDELAADRLLPLVYEELRAVAAAHLRRERPEHTLQPTAIVHEVYLRLAGQTRADWKSRAHFMAVASDVIRRVLVDHARKRLAVKRGGGWQRITLSDADTFPECAQIDLLALDEALTKLESLHARQCRVVKLRFFAGLTSEEVADVLGVHRSTVADDWTIARAWLLSELSGL